MCDEPVILISEQRVTSHPPGLNRANHTISTGPQCGKGLSKLHEDKAVTGAWLPGAWSQEYLETEVLPWIQGC